MEFTVPQRAIGEGVDRLVNVDVTGRGVVGDLYAAARALRDAPLCLEAAASLLGRIGKGRAVILATGFPTHPSFAGEQDGPVGTATLARALVLAAGVRPVIVTDSGNVQICEAALRGAGLYTRSVEDAVQYPTTAAVLPFPLDWNEAVGRSRDLLDRLGPAAIVAIERPGANEHGHYHSARGKRVTDHCGKIDALFQAARDRELLTIGVGDGGNEIGCAAIRETVLRMVPNAAVCACPCGGTGVPAVETDLFVTAAISNWGAYGIEAALALLLERPEIMHSREIDARVYDLCAAAGGNNEGPGLLDVGADALAAPLHGHVIDLLQQMIRGGLDFRRIYRDPPYPWL